MADHSYADYILDHYHTVRELRKTLLNSNISNSKFVLKTAKNYFYSGMFGHLMKILKAFGPQNIIKYFKNNVQGLQNQNKKWNISVSAESDVSWLLKALLVMDLRYFRLKL